MEREPVGFVGAGMMGAPMIRSLLGNGWPVLAYDTDRSRTEAALAGTDGAGTAAGSLEELRSCWLVITMLPTSDAVESVLVDESLAERLGTGSLVVDMSSSVPERTVRLGEVLAGSGVTLVDAPVSGGVARARTGELTAMVGGDDAAVSKVRPTLEAMATTVVHVGPLGSGHAAKALNNVLSACGLLIATETTEVARRFGLEPETFLALVNQATGRNHATETKIARYILSERYDSGFSAQLMLKDLRIAHDLAMSTGTPANLTAALLDAWQSAIGDLPASADQTEVARYVAGGRVARASGDQPEHPLRTRE